MKYNVSIIGSCQSRDIFNSKFIPKYKDYFRVYSYYTMTSILSVMSEPVRYNYNNLEGCWVLESPISGEIPAKRILDAGTLVL